TPMSTLPTWMRRAAAAAALAVLCAGCAGNGFDAETQPLHKQMLQFHEAGHYREAIAMSQDIVARVEKTHPGDDRTLGLALNDLGELLFEGGRYAEAEPILKRSLAIRERVYGPDS